MAAFTSFTFSFVSPDKYTFDFSYRLASSDPTISAYIHTTKVVETVIEGSPTDVTSTFTVTETNYPQFFYQGTPISAYVESSEGQQSIITYGIFQRSNDANNIYMGSNVKYVTLVSESANVKSIILPKIGEYPYNQLNFKYVNTSKSFVLCPYMTNVSYPITTSQFATTDNTYTGIYDSKFAGAFSNSVADPGFAGASFACMSDSSNWYYTNLYAFNRYTPGEVASVPSSLLDSNSQVIYYNYNSNSTQSTIQLSASSSRYIKYIFIRNESANTVTFYIIGPQNSKIETQSVTTGSYPLISTVLDTGRIRSIGFYYVSNTNNFYIMSDYDSDGVTSTSYPASPITFSNQVGIINNESKDIKLVEPIQQLGFARFNTILGNQTTPLTIRLAAPADNASNSIVLSNSLERAVSLGNVTSNTTTSFSYTFATLYLNSSNTSITLPLYRFFIG